MADQVTAEETGLIELNLARREHWVAQLERLAAARPERPAIRFLGATTTWRQLADRVGRLAGATSCPPPW
jgi:fatty-acyl-CoA synthase